MRSSIFFFATFVLTLVEFSKTEEISVANPSSYNDFRLPTAIKPKRYELRIITHLNDESGFEFTGNVLITLSITQTTNKIILHSKDLIIDPTQILIAYIGRNKLNNFNVVVTDIEINSEHDYYIMNLSAPLMKLKKYTLYIPFKGQLRDDAKGYFKRSYVTKIDESTKWISVTQFEPTYARMVFPCFDEPEMKAKFKIFLGHEKKYTSISNMPLKASKDMEGNPGWVWDEFKDSILMSTYLVAFSVNDYGNKRSMVNGNNSIIFRTWARNDELSQVEYARTIGPQILQYFEEYFDIKFPLTKLDQIAIPRFIGAMENWGLTVYDEPLLLYSNKTSTLDNKHKIANTISHELAHQWFGNLVTMKWWTDLWLNEGFATYVASLGVRHFHPDWNSITLEAVENIIQVFERDSLISSHPVSVEIKDSRNIFQIFDVISYKKGSCVIRMINLFLGEISFRHGVTNYLKRYQYKNVDQDDLWLSLSQAAHIENTLPIDIEMKQIMDSWTLQTGYPLITVTRNYLTGGISITQSRYLSDPDSSTNNDNNCWFVPLSYTTESEADFDTTQAKDWLKCDTNNRSIPMSKTNLANPNEWIIFNIQLAGIFKVKYDETNWNLIIRTLMSPDDYKKIHVINRAQLIDDTLDLAWSGDQDYSIAMKVIEYLQHEKEYIPWTVALTNLDKLRKMLRLTSESDYDIFKNFMIKILTPIYQDQNGLNTATSVNFHASKLKVAISDWACSYHVGDCIQLSKQYFQEWRNTKNFDENNPVPVDLRGAIYCAAIKNGNAEDWDFLWERYPKAHTLNEQNNILNSLGCSTDAEKLGKYLTYAFDETKGISKQNAKDAFFAVLNTNSGFILARDYFFNNYAHLTNYFADSLWNRSYMLIKIVLQSSSDEDLTMINNFFESNKFSEESPESVKYILDVIEGNRQWLKKHYQNILTAISARL